MNNQDFADGTLRSRNQARQYSDGSDDSWVGRSSTHVSNHRRFRLFEFEEMLRATTAVAACDDHRPRATAHQRIRFGEFVFGVVLVRRFEVECCG